MSPAVRTSFVLGFAVLTALLSRLSVVLPFSPVPATGQTLGVLLAGAMMGGRNGLAAISAYVIAGLSGVPVFAFGGGPGYLLGPTGGYLAGFLLAAWWVGWLSDRGTLSRLPGRVLGLASGSLLIYLPGVAWLSVHTGGFSGAVELGALPFVFGDLVKTLTAVVVVTLGGGTRLAGLLRNL